METIFNTVTVEQFKDYFYRDFPFLPTYKSNKVYFKDDIVFDEDTEIFYQSLIDANREPLDTQEAWQIVKDDIYNYITDLDVEKAMTQARINAKYYGDNDCEAINIYLHLVAFYLCVDLSNSSTGINSKYAGIVQSKSVGNVSESYAVPTWLQNSPMYSLYGQNGYGLKYMSLISPFLACTILFSRGGSTCG